LRFFCFVFLRYLTFSWLIDLCVYSPSEDDQSVISSSQAVIQFLFISNTIYYT